MPDDPTLRWATPRDFDALGRVMFDAVRHGRSLYTEEQRQAWVLQPRNGPDWAARLAAQAIIVSERSDGVAGFMSLTPEGYIDFAYVRPAAQGQGLFRALYGEIEAEAVRQRLQLLSTHASLMAAPAFAAVGFAVLAEETVRLNGLDFRRFAMEKRLAPS